MQGLFPLLLLWAIGCGPVDRSQLTEEVLKADPSFRTVLEKRDEYASHIETADREFALKQATVQRTMQELREDLAESQQAVRKKTAGFRGLLEPERRRLGFAIEMATDEVRAKGVQRSSLGRSIVRLRKALEGADDTWSEQERSRQDGQLNEMLRDAQRLDDEMAALKAHVKLLKSKLLLLRI